MKDSDDTQRLIRLKRYETPGDEYYETFLSDFKDRQRSELLSRSSRSILAERVSVWFDEMSGAKWLVPAGAAAAAIGVGIFMKSQQINENNNSNNALTGYGGSAINEATSTAPEATSPESFQIDLPKTDSSIPTRAPGTTVSGSHLLPVSGGHSLREL